MTTTQPQITGTTHTLPFDRLSPRDFERLCLWLVEREGYEHAEHLGAAGSEQGRDVIAWREGELWAFQCKRVQRFGPKDALAEVEKVLDLPEDQRPVGLVFIITCDVSANARQQVRKRCAGEMECQFWTGTELDAKAKQHPDIVEEFFGERGVVQRITNIFRGSTAEQRAMRNRQAMLQLVRNTWIKGVLEQSLHGAAMIELGLEERAEAVERPWDMVLQTPDRSNRPLPPGTKIVDVFNEMNRALLILGEPGSGKTTMLLELARDTIARAEQDPMHPIPVVFNLSSWAEKKQPIAEWLVEELNTKYNIPKKIARPWVENDDLLLLLDGLDEVQSELQEVCVKAINDFRKEHMVSLVICSRVAEYEALTTKLRLQGAVLLQPLTSQQVDQYLEDRATELMAVREILKHDAMLQEFAQSPLMLSIMTLAYRGMSELDLQALDATDTRRKYLFDAYVQRMFVRRGEHELYSPEQTIRSLIWLARKMTHQAQSVFFIERMQPDWLATRSQRFLYAVGVRLIIGMTIAFACASIYIPDANKTYALTFGAIAGMSTVLASLLALKMPTVLAVGLAAGLTALLASRSLGWGGGLAAGMVFGLQAGLAGVSVEKINVAEKLSWSWKKAMGVLVGVLGISLIVGLVSRIGLDFGEAAKFAVSVLASVLPIALAFMLALGWEHSKTVEMTTIPNQGFRRSAQNAIQVGLIAILASIPCGALAGILDNLAQGMPVGTLDNLLGALTFYLLIALIVGLPVGLSVGGSACAQHMVLRFILSLNGHIPWRFAHFLNYAAECIFLRKVGGGYIFVHRLLSDYFVRLDM